VDKFPRFYSFFIHHKNNEKHSATKLQSYSLQFAHVPFTTMLIVLISKSSGNVTEGIGVSFKQ
jgi:hypothetical protein